MRGRQEVEGRGTNAIKIYFIHICVHMCFIHMHIYAQCHTIKLQRR